MTMIRDIILIACGLLVLLVLAVGIAMTYMLVMHMRAGGTL